MESIEVIRGPAANLYGNSSGGVLTINTISGDGENKTNYKGINVRNRVIPGWGRTWNLGLTYRF